MTRERDLKDVNGKWLTPAQLKDKFALDFLPQYVSKATIPPGTSLALGYARAQDGKGDYKGVGSGGGFQIAFNANISLRERNSYFSEGFNPWK
jgi:hypothetical protein